MSTAADELPLNDRPHVLYRMYDSRKRLLYVGITADVPDRFHGHREGKDWWAEIASIRLEHLADRSSALAAERDAIKTEDPKYNRTHSLNTLTLLSPEEAQAIQRLERRAKARQRALEGEEQDIAAALRLGIRKAEIVKAIDRSREHVDRIARRHGIPGRYPPRKKPDPPTPGQP